MLIPSTITARRTRRYTSTWYIHPTTHKHDFEPMDGGGRSSFNRHKSGSQSVQVVHFSSAFTADVADMVNAPTMVSTL